jgi:hypothetical protein
MVHFLFTRLARDGKGISEGGACFSILPGCLN